MYTSFLFLFIFCAVTTKISFVSGKLEAEILDGGGELYAKITVENKGISREDLLKIKRNNVTIYRNTCGGTITNSYGRIEKNYYFRNLDEKGEKCTWVIEAPKDNRIYVTNLFYEAFLFPNDEEVDVDKYHDAPVVNIYDGPVINESKRLFRIGEDNMNNTKSTGRHMVIDIAHKQFEVFSAQNLIIQFFFQHEPIVELVPEDIR